MTIKTTKWLPDTCSCVVEYNWDDTTTEANRVNTFSKVSNKCPGHTALTDSNLYSAVLEENQRKNIALQIALNNGPSTLYDLSGTARRLKETVIFTPTWTGTAPNRVLRIQFSVVLTTTQKNTIQSAENTRFGTGRVTVL